MKIPDVPIEKKTILTLDEACEYSGISVNEIKTLAGRDDLDLVLWCSNRRYIKRRKLEEYLRSLQKNKTEDYEKWLGERVPQEVQSVAVVMPDGRIKIELYLERESIRDLILGSTFTDGPTGEVCATISLPQL